MSIMKKNIFIPIVASIILISSCTKDLDVTPIDSKLTTANNVFKTPDDYKQALAKLYTSISLSGQEGPAGQPDIAGLDEGFSNYLRLYWNCQELSTDEAVNCWADGTIKDFHWQTWTPNNEFISTMFSRLFYTVSLCNEFVRTANDNISVEGMKTMKAEARFIRALSYWHAIDLFGNVPFVTEADKPGFFNPKQISRTDLFKYIETELLEAQNDMGEPRFEYGRADKAAAWTLLAKLYLNAKVYAGTEKNTECITYCKKVIDAGYSLANTYSDNFMADNNTSPEIIFAFTFDFFHSTGYGGMNYVIHAQVGGSMKTDSFGIASGWGGNRVTSAFVNKFPDVTGTIDSRALFHTDGQTLEITDISNFTNGYALTKFRNMNKDRKLPKDKGDFVNTDWPVFRLADVYLMYAEAILRGGSGATSADAITYVNKVRERAYRGTSGNVSNVDLQFIIDERARELYWEGHRRTDLIRFGQFSKSTYVWPWKGNVAAGASTDEHLDLYPIPASDLNSNQNLKQNPGY
jgi:hypothetical protein